MEAKEIQVSVLCLAYNHSSYIRDALDGFVKQKTDFAYEVLIHDDASTDGTANIIKEYAEKHPDIIRPVFQKNNQYSKGISIIKSILLPKAKGKYIALCEGDDFWTSDQKIQLQYSYMENHPECSLCVHQSAMVNERSGEVTSIISNLSQGRVIETVEILKKGAWSATNSMFFRTNDLREENPLSGIVQGVGDYPLSLFLATKGYVFALSENMSTYRLYTVGSWAERQSKLPLDRKVELIESLSKLIEEFDKITEFKYHKLVLEKKKSLQFNILMVNPKNYPRLKEEPYRDMWGQMPRKRKIVLWLDCYMSGIASLMRNMKRKTQYFIAVGRKKRLKKE